MGCSYSLQVKRDDPKASGSKKKSKDSASVSASGDLSRREHDELLKIPGRMFLNGATDAACLFTQQGRKGTNQDAMLVWEKAMGGGLVCWFKKVIWTGLKP
ncbi:hypothetical protein Scep_027194 [Stephania cephalantha]|uniref:Uncharacterized protein n=1 Tax=Stephania cephalantha TaxID=152367 RepID=A0AAP0EC39_9MAGN